MPLSNYSPRRIPHIFNEVFNAVAGTGKPLKFFSLFTVEDQIIVELFRKTSVTMLVCYLGFLLFGASMFFAVVSGRTSLPAWACVFNVLPLMLLLFPTRIGGSGNWAGAIMFIGLLFLI